MTAYKIAGAAGVAACLMAGSAIAEEQTLPFRMVVSFTNVAFTEFADTPGHRVGSGRAVGIAVLEDGRIAFKDFIVNLDDSGETGSYSGYSTYTFQNGDALTLRFSGGWSAEGDKGDYEVLSGAGAFEGATGTGHFEAVEEAWEKAFLYEGSFTLDVPAM